jgi:BirA family biotin operon repressor/biotin-[acetyl-CoA-carboxylase] ligase
VRLDLDSRRRLATTTRFTDIELLAVTDSTNRVVAARAAAGAPEGLVVATDLQTAGRGRLDRSWEAEAGAALLVSLLLRPADLPASRWHLLTAAAGLAAARACGDVGGFTPELKWPNDLLVGDRKLAGILAETSGGGVVVGMGLNVHGGPPGAAWADQVAGRRLDRSELLVGWLTALDGLLGAASGPGRLGGGGPDGRGPDGRGPGGWDGLAAAYRAACSTVGRRVAVQLGDRELTGWAQGIDEDGRLVVEPDGGGPPLTVAAGDVTHVRPADGGRSRPGAGEH